MGEEKKAYCPICGKNVSYFIEKSPKSITLDGELYTFDSEKAFCDVCREEIFVESVHDKNLIELYEEYRKRHDLISYYDIKKIPEKYKIGKRPLSLLFGWGEQTLTRYLEGAIPSKAYSDQLKLILNDPRYYLHILEDHKDSIKASSYNKSKKAVIDLLRSDSSEQKINIVANYLLYICGDITPLTLQKALYYCQGFYSAFFQKYLFDTDCCAWVHGPVYEEIYYKYRSYTYNPIAETQAFDEYALSEDEKSVVDCVAKYLCCYSGKILEAFTHTEAPWIDARKGLQAEDRSKRLISKESIKNFFNKIIDKYNMITPDDIQSYAVKLFERYN